MFCVKCGAKLEQGKCPSCGFIDAFDAKQPEETDCNNDVNEHQVEKNAKLNKTKLKKTKVKQPKSKRIKEKKTKNSKQKSMLLEENSEEKRTLTKKKKKVFIIIAAAAAVVLGVGAFLTIYFIKDAKYEEAINYLESDKPETAKQEFEELKSFKDSEKYLEDCITLIAYYDAVDTYENKDYEDALDKFKELGSYKDSQDYAKLSQDYIDYNGAKDFFDAGNFEQAKAIFVVLGDFEDSIDMSTSCQNNMDYNEAQTLYENKEYEGAKSLFVSISDFKDSKDMIFICELLIKYNDAMDTYSKSNYTSAVKIFKDLETKVRTARIDIKGVIELDELRYYQGQCYYKQDLFYSAYKAFNSAGSYQDSSNMASKCKQPIETKELYINPEFSRNSVKMTFYAPKKGNEDICIKVYEEKGELVSICYVKNNEKLKVYFPTGTYYYKISYGTTWYGEKEGFGKEFFRATFEDGDNTQKLRSSYYYWINF